MTDDNWQQLVEMAQAKFRRVKLSTEKLMVDTPEGPLQQGTEDVLEFENEAGRFQLVRENKPAVLDKKMLYSHRQGDTARTEYKLSETEMSHKLRVYKEADFEEWEEVTLDKLRLS